jgi:general secretion pathway protein L
MAAIEDAAANRRCRRLALEELPVPDWDLLNAYGLALKAFHEPKTSINLLPKSLRKKPSRIGQWMLVVLSTAAVLTGLGWLGSHILQQRFMSHRLEANIRELDAQMIEIKQMESNAEALKARISFLEGIKQDGVPILDLLRELSTAIPPTAWIRELNVSGNEIRLDGYADSASELIPVLDASPMITDVTFLSAITRGRDGKEKFRIGFTLAQSSR